MSPLCGQERPAGSPADEIAPANAQRFAADIPGAQVQVFDDLGHIPQEEDPARTVKAVQAFLQ